MNEKQFCPRSFENGGGPNSLFKAPMNGEMHWQDDGTCSYCGSLHPDEFMRRLELGNVTITPTDKSYKVYVRNDGGEPFEETFRQGCPSSPCPDIVDAEGKIDVYKCTHWTTREVPETKFYFQHLSEEQRARFIQLHNEQKMKLNHPGYFYTTPYFCKRGV